MMKQVPRSRLFQRGVAAIEAAFLALPLVILTLGIAEFGRIFYQYNTIAKSTRDAVRYLSQVAPGPGPGGEYYRSARCLAVFGNRDCTGRALVAGLDVDNVAICDATDSTKCSEPHYIPANGSAFPAMRLVTVKVIGYRSTDFVSLPLPPFEFDPISATMRQAL